MVSTLQSLVLYTVPIATLFDLLQTLWHLPMRKDCERALFRRSTLEQLIDLAKTLPWDHPVARALDQEVHRRRMAGTSFFFAFFHFPRVGSFSFFFIFSLDVFPGIDFLRTVLWPLHLCRCPRRTRLNWAARFWVPTCLCRISS